MKAVKLISLIAGGLVVIILNAIYIAPLAGDLMSLQSFVVGVIVGWAVAYMYVKVADS